MTGTLEVLGREARKVQWDTDDPKTVDRARQAFAEAKAAGLAPMASVKGEGATAFRGDDPTEAERVTMVPRMAGG